MVQAIATFMDFCYMARRTSHDTASLTAMNDTLRRFLDLRSVFVETGVRVDFALPRQHALLHYVYGITLFGSPYGLCSSITESKHIAAVKDPWRRSNRDEPLVQILQTNTRMSKLAAARAEYGRRGMLPVTIHGKLLADLDGEDDRDVADVAGPYSALVVSLGKKPGKHDLISLLVIVDCLLFTLQFALQILKILLPNSIDRWTSFDY